MPGLFIKRHAEVAARLADVAVLYVCAVPDAKTGISIEKSVENRVETYRIYYGTHTGLPAFLAKPYKLWLFFAACAKGFSALAAAKGKPDLIHVNVLTRMGLFALWLKMTRGIPYVITEHWSRYLSAVGTYKGILRKAATKTVVTHTSAVSTVSVNLAKAMQTHGLNNPKYLVLPNVVDTSAYCPAETETRGSVKTMIHVSCFEDRSKNITGLLRVLAQLAESRKDFRCIMAGEGIDFEYIKKYALQLGLAEPAIHFTGLLENEALISAYRQADFMVMFSNYENMPVVISESFACGLPVIATRVGGIAEYVNESNGMLVEAGDEKALLSALSAMLDAADHFDRRQIRQFAVENFGEKAVAKALSQLYAAAGINLSTSL